ncbi:MAG: hypothetical protein KBD52_01620 [Candidatus Pacebacteria bacterium]|nr:hypothetical protein [Candidatus Paceibacterota bacterium]
MPNNFFGSKLNSILLLILIVLMVFALRIMIKNKETYFPVVTDNQTSDDWKNYPLNYDIGFHPCGDEPGANDCLSESDYKKVLGNKDDLISFSILPNTEVSGILSYQGSIKGAWFFEANIQINILDANKNVIKASNAMAKTDWMTVEPVEFEGNIDFTGLPKGPAYFEIHNDNPSGLSEYDKSIQIPIIIK